MDREQIIGILRDHEDELKSAGLLHLRLFGSVARGDNGPKSDVDLIAQFDRSKPLTLVSLARYQYQLADLLEAEVDLCTEEWMYARVKSNAVAEAVHVF